MTSDPRPWAAPTLHWSRAALLVAAGLAIAILLVIWAGGWDAFSLLAQVDLRWLALAVAVHYSGFGVRALRWQQLLAALGYRLPLRYTGGLLLSGWFVSALLPARAGDALRVTALRLPSGDTPEVPVTAGLSSIILERLLDIVALLLLSAAFGYSVLGASLPLWLAAGYGAVLLVVALLLAALVGAPQLAQWIGGRIRHAAVQKALHFLAGCAGAMAQLRSRPQAALFALLASLYIWICDGILLWSVVQSLGQLLPVASAAFVALTAAIFAAVPVLPGGLGQVESAYALLLSYLPDAALNVPAAILVTRAISYWSFLLVSGAVAFLAGYSRFFLRPLPAAGKDAP
jgi:uncharacterized protein (TIRG00374 family)